MDGRATSKRTHQRPIRFGNGETVASASLQDRARVLFFETLERMVPEARQALVSDEARLLVLQLHDAVGVIRTAEDIRGAQGAVRDFLWRWQETYNLRDDWVAVHVLFVMASVHEHRKEYSPDRAAEWWQLSVEWMKWAEDVERRNMIKLTDLHQPHGTLSIFTSPRDRGDLGTFDSTVETIDVAVKRIMPELERRLRETLNRLVTTAITLDGAVKSVTLKDTRAFEWLVRYQVFGESKNAIAKDVDRDRGHVTREVNRMAEWIGLTLRT
ncbi:MAG: hypothetical protein QM753_20495 [Thermomicrobiales bacterium]